MMNDEIVFIRVILALVLATAAVAKQGDTRASMVVLRAGELLVAITLLPASSARWGLLSAAILSAGFVGALARSMTRGKTGTCGCFGALDRNLSPLASLFRAGVLFALATTAMVWSWTQPSVSVGVVFEHHDLVHRFTMLFGAVAIAGAFAIPGRLGAVFTRINDKMWGAPVAAADSRLPAVFRASGLPIGTAAPAWPALFDGARDGETVMLVFVGASETQMPDACDGMRVIRVAAAAFAILADEYRVPAVPSAVLVGANGVVRSRLAVGPGAIGRLCTLEHRPPDLARVGATATLPDVTSAAGCVPCGV